jgi:uncharacterized repeat protein (TIGR04044 family)
VAGTAPDHAVDAGQSPSAVGGSSPAAQSRGVIARSAEATNLIMKGSLTVAQIVGERVSKGDAIVDYEEKVFEDIQAEPGEKAYILMHTVPFEGSVGLVNMLTATRINRKGFDTHLVLFGPGSLMAAATRGYPKVGDEPFPGALGYNRQLQTFMDEGGHVYACRFSAAALYGMREIDMMEGVKAINPLDVLDSVLTARRQNALIMQTWTV